MPRVNQVLLSQIDREILDLAELIAVGLGDKVSAGKAIQWNFIAKTGMLRYTQPNRLKK